MKTLRTIAALAAASLLFACATQEEAAKPEPSAAPAAPAPSAQPSAPSAPAAQPAPATPAKAAPAPVQRSVYFDFDKSEIRPEFRSLLEAHASYLRANPSVRARVEGNCDERGSREYNVALGQRRAEAVVKALALLGIDGKRVEPVSYGEEKPRCTQHDESCWAQNRRGDITY